MWKCNSREPLRSFPARRNRRIVSRTTAYCSASQTRHPQTAAWPRAPLPGVRCRHRKSRRTCPRQAWALHPTGKNTLEEARGVDGGTSVSIGGTEEACPPPKCVSSSSAQPSVEGGDNMIGRAVFALSCLLVTSAMAYAIIDPHGAQEETKLVLIRYEYGMWRVWRSFMSEHGATTPEKQSCRSFVSHSAARRYAARLTENRYDTHVIEDCW